MSSDATSKSDSLAGTSVLKGESAMDEAGRALARSLIESGELAGTVICLSGELGAGKTTLCRGFIRECGVTDRIKSPTYTLLEQYQIEHARICHLDLYRIAESEELEYLGFRELLEAQACLLIEWPERVPELASLATIKVQISHIDQHSRQLQLSYVGSV
jgi:tRNA threonylcarbamoyladenosine biosynthesis protein TsaE